MSVTEGSAEQYKVQSELPTSTAWRNSAPEHSCASDVSAFIMVANGHGRAALSQVMGAQLLPLRAALCLPT